MRRTLADLIDLDEPGWPVVLSWIAEAANPVDILPTSRPTGEDALLRLQVTSRSPMGGLALEAAALSIDGGWVRVLAAGNDGIAGSLVTWNGLDDGPSTPSVDKALIVGHDVLGGFFGVNGGAWTGELGSIFYFAPDTLRWQDLNMAYSSWLRWLFDGDLATFFEPNRWPDWESEVSALGPDDGLSVYPFLWAAGGPIADRARARVPMSELWYANVEMARQLSGLPQDAEVKIVVTDD